MPRGGIGWRLSAALVGSMIALALFAHLMYGASIGDSLTGLLTTAVILVAVTFVAYLSTGR